MQKIDKEIFNKNLLLTQAYCELQLTNSDKSNAEILRSFNPEHNGEKMFSFEYNQYFKPGFISTVWSETPLWKNFDVYVELFEKQLLHKKELIKPSKVNQYEGRIMTAQIEDTIFDGCSEANSDGFIDVYDCPPIDTWFYFAEDETGKILYAWVPQPFVALTDIAVAVNAMDCLEWLK